MNNQSGTKQIRKWILAILLVVVLSVAAVACGAVQQGNSGTAGTQYQTVQVEKGTLIENIGATGAVRPNQSAMLIWKTAGTVGAVNVSAGDKAKMGDVLATLKSDANLVALQANLTIAQENLAQMISPQAVANARLAVTTAQTNVNNAQTALNNEQYWQNTSLIQNYYANYVLAKDRLDKAQTAYDNAKGRQYINNTNQAAAYNTLYTAQQAYNNAKYYYSLYSQAPTQNNMDQAQATLDLANSTLKNAQIYLAALTGGTVPADATGSDLFKLNQARLAVQIAQANLDFDSDNSPLRWHRHRGQQHGGRSGFSCRHCVPAGRFVQVKGGCAGFGSGYQYGPGRAAGNFDLRCHRRENISWQSGRGGAGRQYHPERSQLYCYRGIDRSGCLG